MCRFKAYNIYADNCILLALFCSEEAIRLGRFFFCNKNPTHSRRWKFVGRVGEERLVLSIILMDMWQSHI